MITYKLNGKTCLTWRLHESASCVYRGDKKKQKDKKQRSQSFRWVLSSFRGWAERDLANICNVATLSATTRITSSKLELPKVTIKDKWGGGVSPIFFNNFICSLQILYFCKPKKRVTHNNGVTFKSLQGVSKKDKIITSITGLPGLDYLCVVVFFILLCLH